MAGGREVFVTGATGFIGGRLAERLLERGDRLRCLVRTPSAAAHLESRGVRLIEGDIMDPVALERGLDGVGLAYHLAAIYDIGVVDEAALERTNVDGTQTFLRAIEHAGTALAVYVSTTAALAPRAVRTEDAAAAWRGPFPSIYHRTKSQAHRTARDAQERGLPLVIVCPPSVYGPGDEGPTGRLVRSAVRGRLPGLLRDPARFEYAYVDDVVQALVAAGERGRPGATYILGGEPVELNGFVERVAAVAGRSAPALHFPTGMALLGGRILDRIGRAMGKRFVMTREGVASTAGHDWTHDDARASTELGYEPRPLMEGLPPTVAWAQRA